MERNGRIDNGRMDRNRPEWTMDRNGRMDNGPEWTEMDLNGRVRIVHFMLSLKDSIDLWLKAY